MQRGPARRAIAFDPDTYQYVRVADADVLLRALETQVVKRDGTDGLWIERLDAGSLWAALDFRKDDVLVTIAEAPCTSAEALRTLIAALKQAQEFDVVLIRGGKRLQIRIDSQDPHMRRRGVSGGG